MIARTANVGLQQPSHRLVQMLADALTLVFQGAAAVADDVGWSAWRWYQVRDTVKVLSHLDDHMLRDIGVTRASIASASASRVAHEETIRRLARW
jgi:uncharacterized protein YjiS (DUF1127 family)